MISYSEPITLGVNGRRIVVLVYRQERGIKIMLNLLVNLPRAAVPIGT